jgi:hypothetical protein
MAFVPYVPPSRRTQNLTPRAQELNARLSTAIEEFRRYYPDTTDADVRRALDATGDQHAGPSSRQAALAMFAAGLVAAVVGALVAAGGIPEELPPTAWIGLAVAGFAVVVAIMRIARRE